MLDFSQVVLTYIIEIMQCARTLVNIINKSNIVAIMKLLPDVDFSGAVKLVLPPAMTFILSRIDQAQYIY